ncbi:hypothetical protein C1T31_13055 [Hanstruepera neustonica]|uniref:Lipocalin-like domain-containing protein n=1 Tax=Hanstruepera neustonica TaxID=1445657 RepID=A0A2K1DW54_9FLAO|nr:hypothetical protein [Hanstruepera neustonica]PNQ72247.1 hypothetical protein C1T31_13055 [Hanstruepera neustonica]
MKYLNYNITLISLIVLLLISCKNNNEDYVNHLNGYWEIESVILPDGQQKDYTFSDTVDYITVNDSLTGFRKKLKPTFNGNFETSNLVENFTVKFENDSLNLYYKTPYDHWKETVLNANDNNLQVINASKIIYNYRKYQPINLD